MEEIATTTAKNIVGGLDQLLGFEPDGTSVGTKAELYNRIDEATENLTSLDVSEGWKVMDAQVSAAREGDPMRNMDASEKVLHLLSKLEAKEQFQLTEKYPKNFAQHRILETGELAGFALTLFGLGLTKRKGIYTGSRQTQKFAAQFRDAQHIEEASRCDCFMTFDQGASELATSTFAYAGFQTQTLLLKRT